MAYVSQPVRQHGGGHDPSGIFVPVSSFQQSQKAHCGGGDFDPNSPYAGPSVTAQPLPIEKPNFNAQGTYNPPASTSYYHQPQQQPPQYNNARPGFIAQLCACFR
ncbi:hypothetical protein J1614_000433 [Plenodomus biglobosus]|nr:hypothetical protein J1614_000433 [Plenodomus biglobosus]